MTHIHALDPRLASGKSKELLEALQSKLGAAPNILRTMAHAPYVLEGYLALSGALAKGTLSSKLMEQIALLVAQKNTCHYCLAAHTALGKGHGVSAQEAKNTRLAKSADAKTQAVLSFTSRLLDKKGEVSEGDMSLLRIAGFYDNQIIEIISVIGLNMFTNYLVKVAGTEIDFPPVDRVDINYIH
jgi:uncharacterized peroxidase-related enzyme